MTDVIQATKRDSTGTAATTRLRREGNVPAVLYGHGKANEHLAISAVQINGLLRHHIKTVTLTGDINETAMVSDMQWDPLGIDVLHLDLIRVNLQEKVEVIVSVEPRGEAAGVRDGGIFLETVREIEVRCSAGSIPESLELDINDMQLGDQATVADLELPDGIELITDPETVIAHVEAPRTEEELDGEEGVTGAEPEVISKVGDEEDEKA